MRKTTKKKTRITAKRQYKNDSPLAKTLRLLSEKTPLPQLVEFLRDFQSLIPGLQDYAKTGGKRRKVSDLLKSLEAHGKHFHLPVGMSFGQVYSGLREFSGRLTSKVGESLQLPTRKDVASLEAQIHDLEARLKEILASVPSKKAAPAKTGIEDEFTADVPEIKSPRKATVSYLAKSDDK